MKTHTTNSSSEDGKLYETLFKNFQSGKEGDGEKHFHLTDEKVKKIKVSKHGFVTFLDGINVFFLFLEWFMLRSLFGGCLQNLDKCMKEKMKIFLY